MELVTTRSGRVSRRILRYFQQTGHSATDNYVCTRRSRRWSIVAKIIVNVQHTRQTLIVSVPSPSNLGCSCLIIHAPITYGTASMRAKHILDVVWENSGKRSMRGVSMVIINGLFQLQWICQMLQKSENS